MSYTDEQKEIIKRDIKDFDEKFEKIKREFLHMGYVDEGQAEELAWASFVMMNAGIMPTDYEKYYELVGDKQ